MKPPAPSSRIYWHSAGTILSRTGAGFGQPICEAAADPIACASNLKLAFLNEAQAFARRGETDAAAYLLNAALHLTNAIAEALTWRRASQQAAA